MSESSYFTSESGTKYFVEFNRSTSPGTPGPLIIFLHGLSGTTNIFQPLVRLLSTACPLLRYDIPGLGRSPLTESNLSISGLVSDLSDMIKEFTPRQPPILIGHGVGSVIAMQYAATHPTGVSALAAIGPIRKKWHDPVVMQHYTNLAAQARNGTEYMMDLMVDATVGPNANELVRTFVREMVAGQNNEGFARICELLISPAHNDPNYGSIGCPVAVIAGDSDEISGVDTAMGLAALIRRGGNRNVAVTIIKTGHHHVLEDTAGVASALARLLAVI